MMRSFFTAILLVALWAVSPGNAAPVSHYFFPNATDPAIDEYNNRHYAVSDPAVVPKGRLVVFLPGTGAVPFNYTRFIDNAASLGCHSLGLMYANGEAISSLCLQNAPNDPACAGEARLEVIDGVDRVPFLTVNRTNSIENRLFKALQYLSAQYPSEGWGQYLSGDTVEWDKITICGHSQGGGHAALIAKTRDVDRCVMLDSMDYWVAGGRPYDWVSQASATPVSRYFMLTHERDEFAVLDKLTAHVAALDVDRYGEVVNVDASQSPFEGSHFLTTNLEPARGGAGKYHGTPVSDVDTPLAADGVSPVLKPAWDYLLLHETSPVALTRKEGGLRVVFSPGILEFSDSLEDWTPLPRAESPLAVPVTPDAEKEFYRLQSE